MNFNSTEKKIGNARDDEQHAPGDIPEELIGGDDRDKQNATERQLLPGQILYIEHTFLTGSARTEHSRTP